MAKILEQVSTSVSYEEERGKPMPSYNHGKLQANLVFQLMKNYETKFDIISEISIKIDDWGATPDIGIFSLQPIDFQHDRIKVDTAPLCAIEILSPTQSLSDLTDKAEMFFHKGAKSYWLVIPQFQNIYVFDGLFSYKIYQKSDILKDAQLNIELDLKQIFK